MTLGEQFDAILHGAAMSPITDRAFLRITGADATRWLNGMVTNSIQSLAPGEGNYNFLLNAQGRILGDCTIYRDGDSFLLTTDKSQLITIQNTLDKFIIMDDVELSLELTDKSGSRVLGPGALATLDASCIRPTPPISLSHGQVSNSDKVWDTIILSTALNQYELWGDESLMVLMVQMRGLGLREVSPEALEAFRIYTATPRYGTDIRNSDTAKDLPQETALNGSQSHALHFAKGCYLGQEIVERIRSRGQVHRTFAQFTLTGDLPSLPVPLTVDGKPAGELTSAALIPLPAGDTLMALGYIRREFLSATVTYPGGTAKILNHKP